MTTCTCGTAEPHEIARRKTADDAIVCLWSDGAVTGALGRGLVGVPVARPRIEASRDLALRAGWLLVGEVEIHDRDSLPALYAACRWAAQRDGLPGTVRARLASQARPTVRPVWTVTATDRDGNPTEREWRVSRLVCPTRIVIVDHMHGADRYEVTRIATVARLGTDGRTITDEIAETTGIRLGALDEIAAFLDDEARLN